MPHRLSLLAAAAASVATAAAGVFASAAMAVPTRPASGVVPAAPAAGSSRVILLINGDQVTVTAAPTGLRVGRVVPAGTGLAGEMVTMGFGGKTYEIPAAAVPYLGRGLDPALFDVTRLTGTAADGRLPVRVSYQGRLPALPGVTITQAAGGIADGYLTASSARAFGAGLARQYLTDHARASYGTDGMFGSGVSIGVAGATPARATQVARPQYAMRTLTVNGTNLAGRPDAGDIVYVFNADNSTLFSDPVESQGFFYHGTAKFSVPAGHYWAIAGFTDIAGNTATAGRVVVLPQFTVSGTTTVRVRERAATSKITMVTPRPSVVQATAFEVHRPPATGPDMYSQWFADGAFPLWVSPTSQRPTVGTLRSVTDQWLTSPAGAGTPYDYDLAYPGPSEVIPGQRHVVGARGLAMVDARYYSAVATGGSLDRFGLSPIQFSDALIVVPGIPLSLPGRRIEYTSGDPSIVWQAMLFSASGDLIQGDAPRGYRAGERVSEGWDRYPLHPAANVNLVGAANAGGTMPSASRAGDTLAMTFAPFSDNQPGHTDAYSGYETDAAVTASYEIDQNGVKIAGGDAATSAPWQAALSPSPSVIRFVLNASRAGALYPLSTQSQTVWTWHSAHEAGTTLPAGWTCVDGSRSCAVQPLLTLRYAVAGMAPDGSVTPGRQVLHVAAGHLQLASAAKVTGVTVQVSLDDGTTWQTASVAGGNGNYRAAYTAAAGAGYVTLRVTAGDAAGSQITETITRAYRVAS
jgi:hypothetical protein